MTGLPRAFRSVVAFGVLALVCAAARANDIYVAQAATGSNTGQSCADAHDYAFFNSSGNWGLRANQIGPGTTVHLCGTFTAEPGSSGYLTFQGSGSEGSPVTLRFESGALLQCAYWGPNGAIFSSGRSYLVVDGGANGVIQATDNGTSLGNQRDGKGVFLTMCDNCEVKNLSIANIYVHSSAADESGQDTYGVYGEHNYSHHCILWLLLGLTQRQDGVDRNEHDGGHGAKNGYE